jgi:hypothetical protein
MARHRSVLVTRRGHLASIVVCPVCKLREVKCLPHSQLGHYCKAVKGGDKWRWFIPLDPETEEQP